MGRTSDTEYREKRLEDRIRRLERKLKSRKAKKRRRRRKNGSVSSRSRSASPRSHSTSSRSRSPLTRSRSLSTFDRREHNLEMDENMMEDGNCRNPDGDGDRNLATADLPLQDVTNKGVPIITDDIILPRTSKVVIREEKETTDQKSEAVTLSEEVLKAMGKRIAPDKILGPPIHKDIAERWIEIVKKGLPIDERSEIVKKYPSPENCTEIEAPKLNPELKAAANEAAITRDARIVSKQERIAGCLTAVSKALSIALNGNGDAENLLIIEYLCDSGRLLSDLQREESAVRKSLMLTGVSGPAKNMLQNASVDEWLCGKNLDEQLKAAKAVQNSMKELKPPVKNQKSGNPKNFKTPPGQYQPKSQTATGGGNKYTSRLLNRQESSKGNISNKYHSIRPYRKSYQQKDRNYSKNRR